MNMLITGGASGLGAAIVRRLAAEPGNRLYFTYASSHHAAQQLMADYPGSSAIHCDFSDDASVDSLIERINGMDLDVLINNAHGPLLKEHFYKTDPAEFLNSFRLNVMPTLRITQRCIKSFRRKRTGRIINIISSAVVGKPPIGWDAYVANKSYLLAMSKSWASEGVRFGVTSNAISPSFMLTPLNAGTDERIVQQLTYGHPLKRLLTVEEVADTVAFYARATPYINGTHLVLNAGVEME